MSKLYYRIEWEQLSNGYLGHGDWSEDKANIEAWVKSLNKEYKNKATSERVHHWVGSSSQDS